ncbi:uncharacterized protein LOC113778691 [Coffea eugenioides]|uniref:uncharacterized protein LOC113778691 n=1 Tax=Coffea eugenioides TaxID=49369 RepID=UPI000F604681|nr:uncharacterized protein LOC113778691 [Coffea eugenioides]
MSIACGVGCVVVIGCIRWAWKRCSYIGSDDSEAWPIATMEEFEPIPRICRVILAVYDPDPDHPQYPPSNHYRVNYDNILKRVTYEETQGHSPPYIIYSDHENREIVLAIRGLNLYKESHYKILWDNNLGRQMFDGGYVHHGLLKSATWILSQESETLKMLWMESGKNYNMVFAGHSLGAGIAALLTVIVVNHGDQIGGIPRSNIRCYAVAPARCMSLNLAVKYANVIHSIVLQDDFLPRTPTPLEDIAKSIFCLPCLMFCLCLSDTFMPEDRKLKDPRRLYAPGRIYHIVERKFCRCGRYPPEVRTAIPVDGRFEHIVLSCNATSDHAIIQITNETEKALQILKESGDETATTAPKVPKFDRLQTIEEEHKDAQERAISMNILHAVTTTEEEESLEETNIEIKDCQDEDEDALNTLSKP